MRIATRGFGLRSALLIAISLGIGLIFLGLSGTELSRLKGVIGTTDVNDPSNWEWVEVADTQNTILSDVSWGGGQGGGGGGGQGETWGVNDCAAKLRSSKWFDESGQ